jgi:hypothetical protein
MAILHPSLHEFSKQQSGERRSVRIEPLTNPVAPPQHIKASKVSSSPVNPGALQSLCQALTGMDLTFVVLSFVQTVVCEVTGPELQTIAALPSVGAIHPNRTVG